MSKVLTDKEALEIVHLAILEDEIDCGDAYVHFLEDLGALIADHFGGECVSVSSPLQDEGTESETSYCLHFKHNECVPEGGGVYARFDTDVSVEEWKTESEGGEPNHIVYLACGAKVILTFVGGQYQSTWTGKCSCGRTWELDSEEGEE